MLTDHRNLHSYEQILSAGGETRRKDRVLDEHIDIQSDEVSEMFCKFEFGAIFG